MTTRQYIGARYVPKFADPILHDSSKEYEPLTIVTDISGNSYTSKTFVPAGKALNNVEYWVCTGNYNVQVESYREEVANLNADVMKLAIESDSVLHLFPNLASGGYTGNSSLMVSKNHCVLFDAAPNLNKTAVMNYYNALYTAGVFDNIDTIVISHYHYDHIECLADILAAFPHDNCTAYIAMNPSGYYDGADAATIEAAYATVKSTLEAASIPYVEVTSDITVELEDSNIEIELFNSSAVDYTYYSNNTSYYNDYSMVALVKIGNVYAMYPGDIQNVAQTRIVNSRDLPRVFLYSVHHHGLQNDDNIAFLDAIRPEFGVLQTSYNRALSGNHLSMGANYGCQNILSCAYSKQEIVMDKDGGYIIDGIELQRCGYGLSTITYYVNNEYSGTVHDGTKEHPFTSINEFNSFAVNNRNLNYVINVKATDTPYEHFYIRNYVSHVTIQKEADETDNPVLVGFGIIGFCSYVSLYNLTFIDDTSVGEHVAQLYIEESKVSIQNCEFDGSYGVVPAVKIESAIRIQLSDIYIADCTIKNVTNAFASARNGNITTLVVHFINVTSCYLTQHLHYLIRGIDTIEDVTYYLSNSNNVFNQPVEFSDISNDDRSAFTTLMASNNIHACSLPFRTDIHTYQVSGKTVIGSSVSDLNNAVEAGFYRFAGDASNRPTLIFPSSGGGLIVAKFNADYIFQVAFSNIGDNFNLAYRKSNSGVWSEWKKIESVTP